MWFLLACTGTTPDSPTPDTEDTSTEFEPPTGDPATVELSGTCPMETDHGGFVVEAYTDYSIVDGRVRDGVIPNTVLTEELVDGDCRLLRRENPHCEPACAGDEACSLDEECVPYPQDIPLGIVEVAGLSANVVMEARTPGYRYFDTQLPHPAYTGGELVELRFEAVTLHGVGPQTLVPTNDVLVQDETALTLTWDPPTGEVRTSVSLDLNIDQHGTSPLRIQCEFADTGTGTVTAAMVSALLSSGVSGYPNAILSRHTADQGTHEDACVDFVVASPFPLDVDVEGFIPCSSDDDCPDGMDCNEAIELCQ